MITQLRWTKQARRDLRQIYKGIAKDRPTTAERVYRRITLRALLLREQPLIGQRRPEVNADLRVLVEKPYLIFYRTDPESESGLIRSAEIVRIVHGGRELTGL